MLQPDALRGRGCSHATPAFESLEPRMLLSGGVLAMNSGGGLLILGDELANDIVITNPTPGTLRVASGSSSTTVNGSAFADFAAAAGGIMAFMNGGSDSLQINSCALSGSVYLYGGEGSNTFVLNGGTVGYSVNVTNSIGNDTTQVANVTLANGGVTVFDTGGNNGVTFDHLTAVRGFLYVTAGMGNNTIAFNSVSALSASLFTSTGQSTITIASTTITTQTFVQQYGATTYTGDWAASTSFTGSTLGQLSVFGGSGHNYLGIASTTVNSNMYYTGGYDATMLYVSGGSVIHGTLTHAGGNGGQVPGNTSYSKITYVSGSTIDSTLSVMGGGAGVGWLCVDGSTVGSVMFASGQGASKLQIVNSSHVTGMVSGQFWGSGQVPGQTTGTTDYVYFGNATVDSSVYLYSGAGYELMDFEGTNLRGWLTVSSGQDACDVILNGATVGGSLAFYRGGGSGGPSGRTYAGVWQLTNTTVTGGLSVSAYDGNDGVTMTGSSVGVYVNVNLGEGSGWFGTAANGSGTGCTIGYNGLYIVTGQNSDTISLQKTTINGGTNISMWAGSDTLRIDDVTFNSGVWASTGGEYAPGTADDDTVAVDANGSLSGRTTFNGYVSLSMGSCQDSLVLGAASAACRVVFNWGGYGDGGSNYDTLNGTGYCTFNNSMTPGFVNFEAGS